MLVIFTNFSRKLLCYDHAVRLAPEEISVKLTGYEHNAVTCIGMKTDIPVNTLFNYYKVS